MSSMEETKACKTCGETKPVSGFYRNPPHAKGYRTSCRKCTIVSRREYESRADVRARRAELARLRPRKYDASKARVKMLWARYRLREEDYYALLDRQGGRCAICRSDDPGKRGWHVDHDHSCCSGVESCGKCIRGILCSRCNPMIALAKDDPEILRQAVTYLLDGGAKFAE